LEYADVSLKRDPRVVSTAMNQNSQAYEFAHASLKKRRPSKEL